MSGPNVYHLDKETVGGKTWVRATPVFNTRRVVLDAEEAVEAIMAHNGPLARSSETMTIDDDYEARCGTCDAHWYLRLVYVDSTVEVRCPRCGNEGIARRMPPPS